MSDPVFGSPSGANDPPNPPSGSNPSPVSQWYDEDWGPPGGASNLQPMRTGRKSKRCRKSSPALSSGEGSAPRRRGRPKGSKKRSNVEENQWPVGEEEVMPSRKRRKSSSKKKSKGRKKRSKRGRKTTKRRRKSSKRGRKRSRRGRKRKSSGIDDN